MLVDFSREQQPATGTSSLSWNPFQREVYGMVGKQTS